MSVVPLNGVGPPAAGETQVGQQLIDASLQTALETVEKMRALQSGAEADAFAGSVLKLAQVVALLDPTRDTQGVPLDHQLEMQKMKAAAELEKEKERSKAAAQTPGPSKKTVSVRRDQHGRANSYSVEDS